MYIKNNLIDFADNMYLSVDSLIDTNNMVTGLNITIRKDNVKSCRYDKMYMNMPISR